MGKNRIKAINPIIAALFLIAAAVIVGVAYIAWSQKLFGAANRYADLQVTAELQKSSQKAQLTLYIKNVGTCDLKITKIEVESEEGVKYAVCAGGRFTGKSEIYWFESSDDLSGFTYEYAYVNETEEKLEFNPPPDEIGYVEKTWSEAELDFFDTEIYVETNSSSDKAAGVLFYIEWWLPYNDTHAKKGAAGVEVDEYGSLLLCTLTEDGAGTTCTHAGKIPESKWIEIKVSRDKIEVLDAESNEVIGSKEIVYVVQGVPDFTVRFHIDEYCDLDDVKVSYIHILYHGWGQPPAEYPVIRPGDTVSALVVSGKDAWVSGKEYIVTVTFIDLDKNQLMTKSIKVTAKS
ncbi:MAG: hypothetical protein DRJ52_08730 [Thermoprotei archaeon]|nr:MAG: hypothetical protein DRJ52_08730 [Thermoprotei archaeon]